ncbi:U3 small nucleolar RNA-associated protein MPP10-like [Homarus americanus]|uniref:U3 small nucleolar ribonucleoprotein protein MPP10 n=1 Tax=Homarus americanus TaxID=6706 RepID=A0A8J5MR63_HOMAM|nr:U3 small nucleolar RNA-associated protein MPP10-like [Homarus americanus]
MKMEDIYDKFKFLIKKPEDFLRPNSKLQEAWVEQTKRIYNFLKAEERKYNLPIPENALPQLFTDGLDAEQIWQLVELQNKPLLAVPGDFEELDDMNLCFMVAKLSSLAKYNKLSLEESERSEKYNGELDEGIGGSSDEEDDVSMEEEDEEDLQLDRSKNNEKLKGNDISDSDNEELFEKPEDINDIGLNCEFGDDSEDEEDNFDELIAPEGQDSDENEEVDNVKNDDKGDDIDYEDMKEKRRERDKAPKFGTTSVDTKFFKLRESEWVADNDAIGDNYDVDSEDIDFMADISEGSDEEEGAMYDNFFDGVSEDRVKTNKAKKLSELLCGDEMEDNEEDEEDNDDDDGDNGEHFDNDRVEKEDSLSDEEEGPHKLLGIPKKEVKSTFEKEREKELKVIETLEEANTSEKPWYLRGEAVDTTSLVEKMIMNRIRIKAWDDVERKVKPTQDPYEYKKKLLLDQEKSKKSLAEIYEEEYQKQHKKGTEDGEEEPKEHKEISERMEKLFIKLDGLSNYHYTPRQTCAEVKIQTNLPAINMEEATPVTASDATLLAPQEILEPVRGELRGKTERTSTDKMRERRTKKAHQKKRAKMQEAKLKAKMKKAGPDGKLDVKSTMKVIEKAVKSGQVKVLEGKQNKVVRSSQTFFKQLQEDATKKMKEKRNEGHSKKNKRTENKSASKYLL